MPRASLRGPASTGSIAGMPAPDAPMSDLLRALAQRGEPRRYAKGKSLITEGEQGDAIFIILAGRLRVFASNSEGREITLGVYGPGEYIGEMSLDGGPRSASVVSLDACQCVLVTRRTLEAFIAEHPSFAFELLSKVIRRARAATLSAKDMALNDVYGRLKGQLEKAATPRPDGTREIAERLTHKELANLAGCSREMVSRVLKDLERGGYARAQGKALLLLRPLPTRW